MILPVPPLIPTAERQAPGTVEGGARTRKILTSNSLKIGKESHLVGPIATKE